MAALLTPYELEQLPLMLRELDGANRHFWQMVCWRMENRLRKESSKEEGEAGMAKAKVKRKSSKDQQKQQQLSVNGIEMLETVAQRRAKGETGGGLKTNFREKELILRGFGRDLTIFVKG